MITYVENVKDVKEFNSLTERVGWGRRKEDLVRVALDKTLYSVSAYDYGKIVGYGRIIGDETIFLYIQDIMVDPDYQNQKIGTNIMNNLIEQIEKYREINPNIRVYLGADYNKEDFYRKFGFKTRNEVHLGAGMIYKPELKESKLYNWEEEIDEEELENVIKTLDNGGVIIFPTDTVYGIGCNCFDERAIKKLFEIKNRARYKPINVLTDSFEKIKMVSSNINNTEKELIKTYMPGALTVILDKNEEVPDILTSGLPTIGVRIPNDKIALEILRRINYPLATTSANISGNPDGIKIDDFVNEFDGKVDIIIDGGTTKLQKSSTIVRVENDCIELIRQGTVNIEK